MLYLIWIYAGTLNNIKKCTSGELNGGLEEGL